MDDTIEHLSSAWIEYLNKRHSKSVNREDVNDWNLSLFYPDLLPEEVYAPLDEDDFWKTVMPIDGASEKIQKLINDGHDIYIVTSSSYKTLKSKMENVLFKYFETIDWNHVIVCYNKQMIKGDVLIDDGIHNLVGGDYAKILMDAPYNRNIDDRLYGINRVYNWDEVYNLITSLNDRKRCVGVTSNKKKMRNDIFTTEEF